MEPSEADAEDAGSSWLTEVRAFRLIGAMAWIQQFFPTPLSAYYDLIVFIEETTAARQLRGEGFRLRIGLWQADVEAVGSAWLTETCPLRGIGVMFTDEQLVDTPLSGYTA